MVYFLKSASIFSFNVFLISMVVKTPNPSSFKAAVAFSIASSNGTLTFLLMWYVIIFVFRISFYFLKDIIFDFTCQYMYLIKSFDKKYGGRNMRNQETLLYECKKKS